MTRALPFDLTFNQSSLLWNGIMYIQIFDLKSLDLKPEVFPKFFLIFLSYNFLD